MYYISEQPGREGFQQIPTNIPFRVQYNKYHNIFGFYDHREKNPITGEEPIKRIYEEPEPMSMVAINWYRHLRPRLLIIQEILFLNDYPNGAPYPM